MGSPGPNPNKPKAFRPRGRRYTPPGTPDRTLILPESLPDALTALFSSTCKPAPPTNDLIQYYTVRPIRIFLTEILCEESNSLRKSQLLKRFYKAGYDTKKFREVVNTLIKSDVLKFNAVALESGDILQLQNIDRAVKVLSLLQKVHVIEGANAAVGGVSERKRNTMTQISDAELLAIYKRQKKNVSPKIAENFKKKKKNNIVDDKALELTLQQHLEKRGDVL